MSGKATSKDAPLPGVGDLITHLPIDRSRDEPFGPTDHRGAVPQGGMKIGRTFPFVLDEQMPRLDPDYAAQACDNVVRGQEAYPSLLYLSRARTEDVKALFEASQSHEIKVRWERLWVLSPFFAKLARLPEGRDAILDCIKDDLASVHLLSKFAEQNNQAVKRLFTRMHDGLLELLLSRLVQYRDDPRRAALLSGITATIESNGEVLRKILESQADEDTADEIMDLLYVKYRRGGPNRLSSEVLKEKLQSWRRE